MLAKTELGYGILMWHTKERRSGRYGHIFLTDADADEKSLMPKTSVQLDVGLLNRLDFNQARVRLTAVVEENRDSTHLGDLFLDIKPSKPVVGEEIELGVGRLVQDGLQEGYEMFGLKPSDGRKILWIDPRKLYRLHEQTVRIFVEETDDPDTPVSDLTYQKENGAKVVAPGQFQELSLGDVEERKEYSLPCKMVRMGNLGDGMFRLERPKLEKVGEDIEGLKVVK